MSSNTSTTFADSFFMQQLPKIECSREAYLLLMTHHNPDCEEFWGIFINHQLELLHYKLLHRGTLNYCKIHPRDLFREAVKYNAHSIIIAHNHTSTNYEPSEQDIKLTRQLIKASKVMEIPIVDHIVFNKYGFYSLKQNNVI